MNGSLRQELKTDESASFLDFQLLPEVLEVCVLVGQAQGSPGHGAIVISFCPSRSSSGRPAPGAARCTSGAWGTWPSPRSGSTFRTALRSAA
jgi:hypothetical protein